MQPAPPAGRLPLFPVSPQPLFPRCPGETPRAFSAFMAFFNLGHGRSLQRAAEQLGENPATVKNWSSKYGWSDRIQSYNAGLLQQQAEAEMAACREEAADWARRTREYREQEWDTVQKLRLVAQCFLESVGDQEIEKMTLAQVSRAIAISSRIARQVLSGGYGPEELPLAPAQMELLAALKKAYAQPALTLENSSSPKLSESR
jgi:hypothetical protein